jgi:hypothetical protein
MEKPAPDAEKLYAVEIAALLDPTGACVAKTSYAWSPAGGGKYEITAAAGGSACDTGAAVVTVRNAETGKVLVSRSVDVEVMTNTVFAGVRTPEGLKKGLEEWIRDGASAETTADFPEWKEGQEQPTAGEFPFYPADGMTREAYGAIRAAARPSYCFVQGGESLACYALDRASDSMTLVGSQTFPG